MYLGDYIVIERQTGPFEFEACCVSTGTGFIARVVPDKQHLFEDRTFTDGHPRACPFLRPVCDGRIVCTIHDTRPYQCRAFHCTTMLVYSPDGTLKGKVNGSLAITAHDPVLRELWNMNLGAIPFSSPDIEQRMRDLLTSNGYRVE
jgi:hypothetical protein